MSKLRVLSLAWKYHPAVTSGVGVACEGLNNALSNFVSLTIISPKVNKVKVKEEIVLSGEDLTDEQREIIHKEYIEMASEGHFEVAVRFDPYFTSTTYKSNLPESKLIEYEKVQNRAVPNEVKTYKISEKLIYDDVDIFGENVRDKIFLYNRLVEELARNIRFDIIHAHDWMTFLAGIYLKDTYHKPLVLHVHSLEFDRVGHKDVAWVYGIERFAMTKADMVISVSNYTKGIIESIYGLSGNMIRTIHNAVKPPERIGNKYTYIGGNFKVLFAGRIDGNKGIEYFMDIARQVLARTKDVIFIVAGRGQRDISFNDIEGFNEISPYFHYLGFIEREELFGLYRHCDVLCMPSVSEPFGLTAIEAASEGLPVILSRKTGAAEILRRTPQVDFSDTKKFADFILKLKQSSRLRKETIKNNREDIKGLSWEASAKEVVKLYKELTGRT